MGDDGTTGHLPVGTGTDAGASADAVPLLDPRRVLVVDDDLGIRIVLGRALVRCGYEVFLAEDGAAALVTLDHQPDVLAIVSDITMPTMDGTELATQVLWRHPGKPILFVTSSAADPALLAHPLVGQIRKPVRVTAVRDALAGLIELARTTSRTAAQPEPPAGPARSVPPSPGTASPGTPSPGTPSPGAAAPGSPFSVSALSGSAGPPVDG